MTFDEWWKEYKDRISGDCEIALTETLKGLFRLCFAEGVNQGEGYIKDKLRPKLAELDRTVAGWLSLQPETPDELNEDEKVEEQSPAHEYRKGQKVQVFTGGSYGKWIDGVVTVNRSSLRGDTGVEVRTTRTDGQTDHEGSDQETRFYHFTGVRHVW